VQHCLVASGGGGRSEKQLDSQLDCWWKAKGGVDERPVTVANSDESQPPLAFGDDVWKAKCYLSKGLWTSMVGNGRPLML